MKLKPHRLYLSISRSNFIKNSIWGLSGRIFETLFLSVFFVILSREYATFDFSHYLISNNIYQLIVGFSSLGLGSWFIRELEQSTNKIEFINRFFKIQIGLGFFFYFVNIVLIFLIYQDLNIRILGIILGTNIIFDNFINSIRSLNIAQSQQKKTAVIMAIDGLFKLVIGCILFLHPFSIFTLSLFLVGIRLITVNIFLQIGTSTKISLISIWQLKISFSNVKKDVLSNWKFAVIVGLSIIFWRSATIIVSKFLTLNNVANYEVAYKVFAVFLILPAVASTTIYPQFVKYFKNDNRQAIISLYKNIFVAYVVFGLLSYALILSFSENIVVFIFGAKYAIASKTLNEMLLIFLVLPTALLQANLLVAMKLEKLDMYFNMLALGLNLTGCFVGLYFYKDLSVITYSIFLSFLIFHISQSIVLYRLKISSLKSSCGYYVLIASFVLTYQYFVATFNPIWVFVFFLIILSLFFFIYIKTINKGLLSLLTKN